MADRSDDQIAKAAIDAVTGLVGRYRLKRHQSDAAASVMLTAYNLLRAIEGDEFVIGWLQTAVTDVQTKPCPFEVIRPH